MNAETKPAPADGDSTGRRARYRYGGLLMLVGGAAASFVVPFVGVPLLVLGVVVVAVGFLMPA